MSQIPVIRLTLESMQHSILQAFSDYQVLVDADLRAAVDAYCTPDNIRSVLAREVQRAIDNAVREEVDKFYRYGSGRQAVKQAVADTLGDRA